MATRSLVLTLMLAACSSTPDAPPANQTDPAIADALADPILIDPQLAGAADTLDAGGGRIMVPVGATPVIPGDPPVTLGQIANGLRGPAFAACNRAVRYDIGWMAALPAELNPPRDAMAHEAAGSDAPGCGLRIVRYGSPHAPADVAAGYRKAAQAAGFMLSGDDARTMGARKRDGAAFEFTLEPAGAGSAFVVVTNRGR